MPDLRPSEVIVVTDTYEHAGLCLVWCLTSLAAQQQQQLSGEWNPTNRKLLHS